jgi:hypothetical protein
VDVNEDTVTVFPVTSLSPEIVTPKVAFLVVSS